MGNQDVHENFSKYMVGMFPSLINKAVKEQIHVFAQAISYEEYYERIVKAVSFPPA